MSLLLQTRCAPNNHLRSRDPFSIANELFHWDPFRIAAAPVAPRTSRFQPTFDVKESAEAYVLVADVPGFLRKDIELSLERNELTVSGTRQTTEAKEGENYHISERRHGKFVRTFSLPEQANSESISAELKNGVLTIAIGKKPETRARKIELTEGKPDAKEE